MDTITMLRQQIQDARELMEATMADVTPELAGWLPEGKALPIAAHYAHTLVSEDMGLHGLVLGTAPLAVAGWEGKTGFAAPPGFGPGQSWEQWARETRFDLTAMREYAAAVYAATDECLAGLTDEALAGTVDLRPVGFDERSLAWFLTTGWATNVHLHSGEISCLKGLRGLKGYPM
jgi:hypothetical protein